MSKNQNLSIEMGGRGQCHMTQISFQMLTIISHFKLHPFTRMCSAEYCLKEQLQSSCGTNFKKISIYIMFNAYNGFSNSNNEKIFLQKLRKENQISPCHISCKQAKGSCIVIKEPRQRHLEKRTRTCSPFTIKRNRSPDQRMSLVRGCRRLNDTLAPMQGKVTNTVQS